MGKMSPPPYIKLSANHPCRCFSANTGSEALTSSSVLDQRSLFLFSLFRLSSFLVLLYLVLNPDSCLYYQNALFLCPSNPWNMVLISLFSCSQWHGLIKPTVFVCFLFPVMVSDSHSQMAMSVLMNHPPPCSPGSWPFLL